MFPELDPENNEEHRCLCGSKKVKPIMFVRDPEGTIRIYCKPCYEKDIWSIETKENWIM